MGKIQEIQKDRIKSLPYVPWPPRSLFPEATGFVSSISLERLLLIIN